MPCFFCVLCLVPGSGPSASERSSTRPGAAQARNDLAAGDPRQAFTPDITGLWTETGRASLVLVPDAFGGELLGRSKGRHPITHSERA